LDAVPASAQPAQPAVVDAAPAYAYAPGDIYPVGERERELCAKADHPDWWYLGGLFVLDMASAFANSRLGAATLDPTTHLYKPNVDSPFLRQLGPASIGLAWGATIGGGYLALPKCDPHWVSHAPREGDVRSPWPLALTLATVGGMFGASMTGVFTTLQRSSEEMRAWTTEERAARLWIGGISGFVGALVPYLLPPRTWSGARELANIRATADAHGAGIAYSVVF
jgi:hypothetical protein